MRVRRCLGEGRGHRTKAVAASALYVVSRESPVLQTLATSRGGAPTLLTCPHQTYFEDNPRDLQLLRHDLPLHPAVVKPHLGHVPDYLGERTRGPRGPGAVQRTGPWRPEAAARAQMLRPVLGRGRAHLGHTGSHLPVARG